MKGQAPERGKDNIPAGNNGGINYLAPKEARELFDSLAQGSCGMSGGDFVRAWNEGRFQEADERPEIAELAVLMPLYSED